MESAPIAISEPGPRIALHAVGLLEVLQVRFREVLVPLKVWAELTALPGAPEPIAAAAVANLRLVPDLESIPSSLRGLDPGEQQALALATSMPGVVVLIDDGAARRAARVGGLKHIGTIGLIAAAKEAGLCASARDRYLVLLATRFRVDRQVVNDVLRSLGEAELEP